MYIYSIYSIETYNTIYTILYTIYYTILYTIYTIYYLYSIETYNNLKRLNLFKLLINAYFYFSGHSRGYNLYCYIITVPLNKEKRKFY